MRGLQNKVAIVAGGAPGNIGGASAVRLAQEGMKVVVARSQGGCSPNRRRRNQISWWICRRQRIRYHRRILVQVAHRIYGQ